MKLRIDLIWSILSFELKIFDQTNYSI